MLLDKHRRCADQKTQRQRDPLQMPLAERLRVKAGQCQRRAADDVHAGQDVRVGVGGINALHEPNEEIVLREFRRAQILSVREDQAEKDRRLYNLYVYQGKWQSCLTQMFSEAEDKPIVPDPKKIDICAPMPDDENKKFWEETEKESALMGERTPKKKTPF